MVNTQSELMLKAQALMKQRDELEAQIKSHQDDLQSVHSDKKLTFLTHCTATYFFLIGPRRRFTADPT